jgi:hypothetical protein
VNERTVRRVASALDTFTAFLKRATTGRTRVLRL